MEPTTKQQVSSQVKATRGPHTSRSPKTWFLGLGFGLKLRFGLRFFPACPPEWSAELQKHQNSGNWVSLGTQTPDPRVQAQSLQIQAQGLQIQVQTLHVQAQGLQLQPWGVLVSFGGPWGGLGEPWGSFGKHWGSFGEALGSLGEPWGALGKPWGALGKLWESFPSLPPRMKCRSPKTSKFGELGEPGHPDPRPQGTDPEPADASPGSADTGPSLVCTGPGSADAALESFGKPWGSLWWFRVMVLGLRVWSLG